MNILRKNISLLLILVLSFYIVPKEFVHACYDHEDTSDYVSSSASSKTPMTIGSRHIHCELLNFETDLFHPAENHTVGLPQSTCFAFLALNVQSGENACPSFISLRGPPLC